MGFLTNLGNTIEYEKSEKERGIIKNHAKEFVLNWNIRDRSFIVNTQYKEPLFGYEAEVHYVSFDDQKKTMKINLEGEVKIKQHEDHDTKTSNFTYQLEYGRWMIEVITNTPFKFSEIYKTEESLQELIKDFNTYIGSRNYLFMSVFPMLGVGDYYKEIDMNSQDENNFIVDRKYEEFIRESRRCNPYSNSDYTNDIVITCHPRFEVFTQHCRSRTGKKQSGLIPIFQDKLTNTIHDEKYPGFIHLDSFTSGMGNGCLQVTFGIESFYEAIYCYDQLIPLMPILIALTGSSSIVKGKLSGWDNRFNILTQLCDDRTDDEKDPSSKNYIYKSRYSNVYSYISDHNYIQDHHNNYPRMPIDNEFVLKMKNKGFPKRFSEFIAQLFVREPMIVFEKYVNIENKNDPSHFLNLMSTNWNSLRFKPPLEKDGDLNYKIEVRPCDLQFTPYENSSIITFILLYTRLVLNYDANFIIPMDKNDINFSIGHLNDAIHKEKFFWRTNGIDKKNYKYPNHISSDYKNTQNRLPNGYENPDIDNLSIDKLLIHEILGGKGDFPGLIPLMKEYISENYPKDKHEQLFNQLDFIYQRSNGNLLSNAQYIRKFVKEHKKYNHNSIVTEEIAYDLGNHIINIQQSKLTPIELYGEYI